MMLFFTVLLLASSSLYVYGAIIDNSSECSNPWTYHPSGSTKCICGQSLGGGVICDEDRVYLRVDYTMTLHTTTNNSTEVILAPGIYGYDNYTTLKGRVYTLLPNNSEDLNKVLCMPNNRKGFLCENCIEEHGPTLYSPKCADCKENSFIKRMTFFLALKLVPITVIYIILVLSRLNITQGPILGYVIFCQCHTTATILISKVYEVILYKLSIFKWILNGSLFLSAFWALDYSPFFGSFCISSSLNSLQVLFLNYISVFYPIVLMVITYAFIELHARNFKPVVYAWRPFNRCYAKIRRNLNATDSIIHAYATLLLLSFSTLNFNSFLILKVANVYNITETKHVGVLYYRPSVNVHEVHYILYFTTVLAIMLTMEVVPATLLCVYSIKKLRKTLDKCCSQRVQIAMNTFADTFQGTFKHKYRILPAVLAYSQMFLTFLGTVSHTLSFYIFPVFVAILVIISFLIAYARPCKSLSTDISLSFHLLWMGTIALLLTNYLIDIEEINIPLHLVIAAIVPVPHILMILWVLYKILNNNLCLATLFKRLVNTLKRNSENSENLLPDRLENSQRYNELESTSDIQKAK